MPTRTNLATAASRFTFVRYLEPGRKRRPRRPSLRRFLWIVAAALALSLLVQILLR
jgi:hypothetical protein